MEFRRLCFFYLSLHSVFTGTAIAAGDEKPTVYEALRSYDFPVGLLPQGITGYDLNSSTGEFSAYLNDTCSFKLEEYELRYKPAVKGVISKGRLQNLNGVSVKAMLVWWNIDNVKRSGDNLEFTVGIAAADFPVSNFGKCPQCGCGLDCDGVKSGFVSSS